MRIQKPVLSFLLICISVFTFQACSKSDGPAADPIPVVLPDTLSAGWTKQVVSTEQFGDIFFINPTDGYLLGNNIYKTTNGGVSWTNLVSYPSLYNSFVTTDGKAFFITDSRVVKTVDGGSSFQQFGFTNQLSDLFFTDNNNGFCVDQKNNLYHTTDAGVTWPKVTTTGLAPVSAAGYNSLFFVSNSTGWISTEQKIYKSNGSFDNWQQASVSGGTTPYAFLCLYASSPTIVYAASRGEIFKSTDAGSHFSFIQKVGTEGFCDIHFLDDFTGYMSLEKRIFKTTDGGLNWTKVLSLGEGYIIEIHFTDVNHGWACGGNTVLIFKQ